MGGDLTDHRGGRGAALVEMALVLPVLVALAFGAIEYGWMFFRASQVNQAARHGARTAVRPAATEGEIEAAVDAIMTGAGFSAAQYTLTIVPEGASPSVGSPVTVQVVATYPSISGGLVPAPGTLHGAATMAKEGPE